MMKKTDNLYICFNKFKINIFFPITIIILYINESIESILLIISAVIIHEMGHFIAAALLCVKIKHVAFEPFGCTISIDEYTDYRKEIIIALFGPIAGLIVSLFGIMLMKNYSSFYLLYFIFLNITYSLVNIIPCSELDGGKIVEAYLYIRFDIYKAYKITELINIISSVILILLMIFTCLKTGFNFSLTSLCLFIIILFPNKKTNFQIQL